MQFTILTWNQKAEIEMRFLESYRGGAVRQLILGPEVVFLSRHHSLAESIQRLDAAIAEVRRFA